jgi:Zn-dependent peptidase ImmA (M78 family)
MSTVEKGDKLEDQLHDYLLEQQRHGELVFGAHPAALCEVHKKKKYFCNERGGDVEFDVVVEVRRSGRTEPYLFVLFECKNHKDSVQERDITDFSDKIGRIFGHAAKGLIVTASRLQSGAENIARNRRLGIVKFDANGIDVIADRTVGAWAEHRFVQSQIIDGPQRSKSLKFSAYSDGRYFGSLQQLLHSFETDGGDAESEAKNPSVKSVKFLPETDIQAAAQKALSLAAYDGGEVVFEKLCAVLAIDLSYSNRVIQDADGNIILGSANFSKKSIDVNLHGDRNRERFTVAHEIGHFCLHHDKYLRSESIVERDLFVNTETDDAFNYERLEYQANLFGSVLLLPEVQFLHVVSVLRQRLDIYNRGFGYIFVDDQPCNYTPYNQMLSALSDHFGASRQAIEIRLKRAGLVTDERKRNDLNYLRVLGAY